VGLAETWLVVTECGVGEEEKIDSVSECVVDGSLW
jgi:hypothetical protein